MNSVISEVNGAAVNWLSNGFGALTKNWVQLGMAILLTIQGIEFYDKSASQLKESIKNVESLEEKLAVSHAELDKSIKNINSSGEKLNSLPTAVSEIAQNVEQLISRITTIKSNMQSQLFSVNQHLGVQDQQQIDLSSGLLELKVELKRNQVNLKSIAKDMHAAAVYAVLFDQTSEMLMRTIR